MSDQPEFLVERGLVVQDEPFAIGMAKLLEREGKTVAAAELRRLHKALHDIYEVWAGSEGIPVPQTAPEAYLLSLVEHMRYLAKEGLK